MKQLVMIALALLMIPVAVRAQAPIPNGDFEAWFDDQPDGWFVDNIGTDHPIERTSDAHSGMSALHGRVMLMQVNGGQESPIAISGGDPFLWGSPYTDKPRFMTGYYKFISEGGDKLVIYVGFKQGGSALHSAEFNTTTTVATYQPFFIEINWPENTQQPDSMFVNMTILDSSGSTQGAHIGSEMFVDDLRLKNTLAVRPEAPVAGEAMGEPYPQPANRDVTIRYTLGEHAAARIQLFDASGRIVRTTNRETLAAGEHRAFFDVGSLPSGVYLCRIDADSRSMTKRLVVMH